MDRLLTVKEIAQLLALSPRTIYSLAQQGRIPHLRLGERVIRFDRDAVLEHMGRTNR